MYRFTPRLCQVLLLAAWGGTVLAAGIPTARSLPSDWYPESVAAATDGSLYISSWRQGAVARLSPNAATADILVKSGSLGLANGQGVLVDAKRNLLWVCSGAYGATTVAMTPSALKSYDLASGAPRRSYPLPAAANGQVGYCNDLAADEQGNLYITDSIHPRVLRLPVGADALETWVTDAAFAVGGTYTLNGVALDRGQLYLSTVMAADHLFRVGIKADGSAGAVERIAMPRPLKNADALRVYGPGRLVIFESNAFGGDGPYGGQITLARIEGDHASLQTVVAGLNDPSSGAVVGKRVYFIESKYPLLLKHPTDDLAIPRGVPFDLQSSELPDD